MGTLGVYIREILPGLCCIIINFHCVLSRRQCGCNCRSFVVSGARGPVACWCFPLLQKVTIFGFDNIHRVML